MIQVIGRSVSESIPPQELERSMMGKLLGILACVTVLVGLASADTTLAKEMIDFESGYARLDEVSSFTAGGNTLHVSLSEEGTTFIANVGNPKDAFENVINGTMNYDVPTGGSPGNFFLTDGVLGENNFRFDFDIPVSEFSLDLYDFRGDGGARISDFVTLRAFSDAARTHQVAMDEFVVLPPRPVDGLTLNLSVAAPLISALTLEFSTFDRGTGIDNITFVTIPEPSAFVLLGMAAPLLFLVARSKTGTMALRGRRRR